ncbi:Tim10/DDP family zinc finger-domain-containing protein [Hypoxylon trugodes]|uniref:Tim10/DDP family zinc finger-domain-containing protein n=1 Tax=Hypoxylon trugodes TaxID=326681 RepID=UPI00219F6516|nr:Tim10/DDP family zinc finger-domain-containing protein [Hypoxylon trugodes]KAI1393896.1 Tim10/DDP family zinc finger-domain-containing protein [Hypoxylon trugodes]
MSDFLENIDPKQLNDKDKRELRLHLDSEAARQRINISVHAMTDVCFKQCVTGPIRNGKLDKGEESCMVNCTNRFIDISRVTMTNMGKVKR